jgi:hypothetical protein
MRNNEEATHGGDPHEDTHTTEKRLSGVVTNMSKNTLVPHGEEEDAKYHDLENEFLIDNPGKQNLNN